jgi:NAD(P)-dependent dehydrogenase (short-subunit alcohol dehydrogenase family)
MTGRLDGKIAVITGGSSGLGAATVELFLAEGARVVVADLNEPTGGIGANARFARCDVTREADIAEAIGLAKRAFGGLDILFNNAGASGTMAPLGEMDANAWDATMALLPRAAMLGIKHAVPLLAERGGGSIINTASIAGMRTGISTPAYTVAKAAVLQLTRAAAMEFGPRNIRVNNICPGIIPTGSVGGYFGIPADKLDAAVPKIHDIFATAQPLPRSGRPIDIAQMALFLASDASAFATGQDFVVDGGMMLMGPGSLEVERGDGVIQRMIALSQSYQAAPESV